MPTLGVTWTLAPAVDGRSRRAPHQAAAVAAAEGAQPPNAMRTSKRKHDDGRHRDHDAPPDKSRSKKPGKHFSVKGFPWFGSRPPLEDEPPPPAEEEASHHA
ncbi:hypothetical protein KEM52_001412, partial [Ascosphaera acerosa]